VLGFVFDALGWPANHRVMAPDIADARFEPSLDGTSKRE